MLILTRLVLTDTLFRCMLQSIYRQDKSLGADGEAVAEIRVIQEIPMEPDKFCNFHSAGERRTEKSGALPTQKTGGPTSHRLGQKVG